MVLFLINFFTLLILHSSKLSYYLLILHHIEGETCIKKNILFPSSTTLSLNTCRSLFSCGSYSQRRSSKYVLLFNTFLTVILTNFYETLKRKGKRKRIKMTVGKVESIVAEMIENENNARCIRSLLITFTDILTFFL